MTEQFGSDDVELLDSETAYQGFFRIRKLTLKHRLFAGGWSGPIHRELFERGDAVGVLLFDPQRQEIAMVEQLRIGPFMHDDQPWLLELVAGIIETDELPTDVARRESIEEAGCHIEELELIASYYSSPGGSTEHFTLFCGRVDLAGVGGIYGLDNEGEDIRVHVIPLDQALRGLHEGRYNNAHTLIALQWLQLHHEQLMLRWQQ